MGMMVDLQLLTTKLNTVKRVENHGRKSTLIVTLKNAWLLPSKKVKNTGLEYPLAINSVLVQMFLLIAHSLLSIQRVFQTSQKTFVSNVCDDSVTLVWEPPSSELEAHLLAYTLEIVRYGESSYTVCAEKIHECSWTVDNLCLGEKLRFRLKCVNSIGTSDPSSPTAWIIV